MLLFVVVVVVAKTRFSVSHVSNSFYRFFTSLLCLYLLFGRYGSLGDMDLWEILIFGRYGPLGDMDLWDIWIFGRYESLGDMDPCVFVFVYIQK